jgi:hypothetical protein
MMTRSTNNEVVLLQITGEVHYCWDNDKEHR